MSLRHYNLIDSLLFQMDDTIRTVFGSPPSAGRPNPADATPQTDLSASERTQSARLMRVNHSGEICAQALYQGQALTAQRPELRTQLAQAALEEGDHLAWCKTRLKELDSHTSLLNPIFYAGSFVIGAVNGKVGDHWNLGFLAETERQVVNHLEEHLNRLPPQDQKSRAILETMKVEEMAHEDDAHNAGGMTLPLPIRLLMRVTAKVMTKSAFWV
jgi:ubiquinone biosynthesis monooxygenase Coq7